jgi:hypothetical protein
MDTQTTFHYRIRPNSVLVWKEGWPAERKQVLFYGEFALFRSVCEPFDIPLVEEKG